MKLPLIVCLILAVAGVLRAQEMVTEPSTEKKFPSVVTVTSGDADITLSLTGVTVRKKFFFKVYGMAHYMESPPTGTEKAVLAAILSDGKAKQIVMEFAREVGMEQIQGAYRDGFRENADKDEMKQIQPMVEQFVSAVKSGVKDGDRYILTWLPGGTIHAKFGSDEAPPLTDPTFARVLWTIWFGDDSIVDPEELVSRLLTP